MIRVIASLQVEGIHNWPECPFEDVSFLRNEHRHIFHIRVEKKVTKEDREIEIIRLKREILSFLESKFGSPAKFGRMSCEGIAVLLFKHFALNSCEVLEDGENGAIVEI